MTPGFSLPGSNQRSGRTLPRIKTAGILGGLGPQSTSLFYDAYTQYCLELNLPAYPRLLINSVNAWEVIEILKEKDLTRLYYFLKKEIDLIGDRIDFLVMVCNSIHAVLTPLRESVAFPILSIYEEVCKEVSRSSMKKVGILGTKTTVDNCFYQEELARYGIDHVILPPAREAAFDAFIFDEMLYGRGEGTMKRLILDGIRYLEEQGCEGVIMACTELPLFVTQMDTDMPLFMSTQVLAQVVVDTCISE